jgi:hypothetical protein
VGYQKMHHSILESLVQAFEALDGGLDAVGERDLVLYFEQEVHGDLGRPHACPLSMMLRSVTARRAGNLSAASAIRPPPRGLSREKRHAVIFGGFAEEIILTDVLE